MFHPFQLVPPAWRGRLLRPFSIATVVMLAGMTWAGADLRSAAAPMGIVSLELARNAGEAAAIIGSWQEKRGHGSGEPIWNLPLGVDGLAGLLTLIDFGFILAYAATLSMACLWVRSSNLGIALAWGVWIAALADALENMGIMLMLSGNLADPLPAITRTCALLKFSLVGAALAYIVWAWTRRKR